MASNVSLKVYLMQNDETEPEIRRFTVSEYILKKYNCFLETIITIFPVLAGRTFKIYWKDEDNDEVAVLSTEELDIAVKSMSSDVKKFWVKTQTSETDFLLHPGVACDGCGKKVVGCRYKCIVCKDYDLCSSCERSKTHAKHPMCKIPNPFCYDMLNFQRMANLYKMLCPVNTDTKHHRRRHSHDGHHDDSKKKRSDKRESGPETGNESDDGCYKEHSHKKFKKHSKCPFSHLNTLATYVNPINFQLCQDGNDNAEELKSEKPQKNIRSMDYLALVGMKLQKLLDPLGINVEVEIRPKKEKKNGDENEEKNSADGKQSSKVAPSAPPPPVKEVQPEEASNVMKLKIDEITKVLADQTMSNKENGDWVLYEELKKITEEPQPSSSTETPQKQESEDQPKKSPKSSPHFQENEKLYPALPHEISANARKVLETLLSMGFTNEGGWLTSLVEAKGDIEEVLRVLIDQKN